MRRLLTLLAALLQLTACASLLPTPTPTPYRDTPTPPTPSLTPKPPTATPTPEPQRQGYIGHPSLYGDAGFTVVQAGAPLPLTWDEFPPGAERYEIRIVSYYDGEVIFEAVDTDSSDGVMVIWEETAENFGGTAQGTAYFADGTIIEANVYTELSAGEAPPEGICTLSNTTIGSVDAYLVPEVTDDMQFWAILLAGGYAEVVSRDPSSGLYHVLDAYARIPDEDSSEGYQDTIVPELWVVEDQALHFFGTCEALLDQPIPDSPAGRILFPYRFADAGNFAITAGTTMPLEWVNYPPGAIYYDFVLLTEYRMFLDRDDNPADGVTGEWDVPENISGTLYGVAYYPFGFEVRSQFAGDLSSQEAPPQNICSLSGATIGAVTIYPEPNSDDPIGIAGPTPYIPVTGQTFDGWYQVELTEDIELFEAQTGSASGWVMASDSIELFGPCDDIPLVQ